MENKEKKTTAIDVRVIYSICGFQQKPPLYFKLWDVDCVDDIISPFLQSYKYRVKSVIENGDIYTVDLEPSCDIAKKVHEMQHPKKAKEE